MAQLHMDLMRVLRINDVDGYINILPAIIEICLDKIDQTMRVGVSCF